MDCQSSLLTQGFAYLQTQPLVDNERKNVMALSKSLFHDKIVGEEISGRVWQVDIDSLAKEESLGGNMANLVATYFDKIFNQHTSPLAASVLGGKVKSLPGRKLLISDQDCEAQQIHLDNLLPIFVSNLYLHDSDGELDGTQFYEMPSEEKMVGKPIDFNDSRQDSRLKLPWTEHKLISPPFVKSGSLGVFFANTLHNGPSVTLPGLRCVMFQCCALEDTEIPADFSNYQHFAFSYALERFGLKEITRESLKASQGSWELHGPDGLGEYSQKQLQNFLKNKPTKRKKRKKQAS